MDISSLTVTQIKKLLQQGGGPAEDLLAAMARDNRSAVQALYKRCVADRQKYEANRQRLARMREYEQTLKKPGQSLVAGVDEAGRGPLAGPVVAAAVILPEGWLLDGLDDSKKLVPARRETLETRIKDAALDWAVGMATVGEIEKYNIHRASMLAMQRAVQNLALKPDLVLLDGKFTLSLTDLEQRAVVGGDGLCPSIAAASVVAKVTRDRLMNICHVLYPEYGFDRHKGYSTASHMTALAAFGPCPIHRRGFAPVKQLIDKHDNTDQNS
ncbi:ribonuclease HII [Desulfoscipio geothermicus]|uniref:Ribonuclease HII n=1 Tax=Desulfoscipio geothermicus DSM 3669 TaxID=1121426 RepID=A0A1I6D6C7_9FIRM|nr:ribonuclease HII [Desulfoscipio geothermicus]SFR01006.1 RNase HII [Desulfoscipio geothermicus DSM 3669]